MRGQFANELLVMIDGRTVYTPLFSGVYWDVQDVMLEDIDDPRYQTSFENDSTLDYRSPQAYERSAARHCIYVRRRGDSPVRFSAARLGLAITLLAAPGCFTESVLSAWDDSARISALGLRARALDASRIKIVWRARESMLQFSGGVIELTPKLDACEQIEILASHSNEIVRLDATHEQIFTFGYDGKPRENIAPAPPLDRECQVLLRLDLAWDTPPGLSVRLIASTRHGELGRATIPAPRNHLWLGLTPASVTADVALVPVFLCFAPGPENLCFAILDDMY